MILKLHYDYTNVYKYTNDYTVYIFENTGHTVEEQQQEVSIKISLLSYVTCLG